MSGVTRNAVIAVLLATRNRRPRHDGQNLRDRRIRDVTLLAIQNVVRAIRARLGPRLDVGGVRTRLFFREREGGELLTGHERREPSSASARGCRKEARRECRSNDARS